MSSALPEAVTAETLACPKCHMFGCDCDAAETISPFSPEHQRMVCVACHRTVPCLCKSTLPRPSLKTTQTGEPAPAVTPEQRADQDMLRYWFERDAIGMRRRLVELHTSAERTLKS